MIYGANLAGQYDADVVITHEPYIYLGFINPTIADRNSITPLKEQNIWKIMRIKTYVDANNADIEYIETMYPNGMDSAYNFAIAAAENYTYDFKR